MSTTALDMDAVRRKLNVTWDSLSTEARLADVCESVSAILSSRLGLERGHVFSKDDGEAWPLFLNACLYEWSGALDDFMVNYAAEVRAVRSLNEVNSDQN